MASSVVYSYVVLGQKAFGDLSSIQLTKLWHCDEANGARECISPRIYAGKVTSASVVLIVIRDFDPIGKVEFSLADEPCTAVITWIAVISPKYYKRVLKEFFHYVKTVYGVTCALYNIVITSHDGDRRALNQLNAMMMRGFQIRDMIAETYEGTPRIGVTEDAARVRFELDKILI
jgi:hypothetical protein